MRKLTILSIVAILLRLEKVTLMPSYGDTSVMIRSKDLMENEIGTEQLILVFPITWIYKQTSNETIEQQNKRIRRNPIAGIMLAAGCVGAVVEGYIGVIEIRHIMGLTEL